MLSSLGAWMDLHGCLAGNEWFRPGCMAPPYGDGPGQLCSRGHRGYLFPFGHQAAYIKVTERKPYTPGAQHGVGTTVMALLQRGILIVLQPRDILILRLSVGWDAGKGGRNTLPEIASHHVHHLELDLSQYGGGRKRFRLCR